MTKPSAGEVFRYPFLSKREQMAGETEGRKARPVCIAVIVAKSDSETVVFILPITTQPPLPSRKSIVVPQVELQRVGLETHVRKWIMLDEINTDILEPSYAWEGHRQLIGSCRKGVPHPWSSGLQLTRDVVPNAVSV